MNQTTQDVIEFLTHPELCFGVEEDLLLLEDPDALHREVQELLEDPHNFLDAENAASLRGRLHEAEWPIVAQEFRTRVQMASRFFGPDAEASRKR